MTQTFFPIPAAALAAALALLGAAPAPAQEPPAPAVVVAPAEMQARAGEASFTGRLVAAQVVDIRARATGFLESVDFTEGQRVAKGDPLFHIEDDSYQAALNQIDGQIQSARAERDLARIERDRQAELVRRGAVPQSNLDQAEASLGNTEGALTTLQAQRQDAELTLSYTVVAAPFDGIAGLAQYDTGALVGPDAGTMVTLTGSDPIHAEFPVPLRVLQEYDAAVERGEAPTEAVVSLTLANGTQAPQQGRIDYLDSRVSEGTDTVLARAAFDNPDHKLRDGEFVTVTLMATTAQEILTVPAQAVSRNLAGSFVMVVGPDGTAEQRQIQTGSTRQGVTEVTGGLEAGEMVVTEGLNKVRPGIKVDAAPAAADPQEG
ncbi:efflux RND transporter periplasmic adaptor subunit [Mangrovicoccus algicola]|uniref:Efflux RND transporter periplasmic adaptor subunit n=1 Tax=Mangrovicoccus algicola TaxID=2771008 RepID=A0A8J7CI95_9RHOB|nr:efflux RND transporter periplasmic adaptor subunit [Mangrovicoccus algicola]MBE3639315.1 efflux RND transporter periplasmic adaptor subunit [Mangrovicoccus algicola]